MAQSMHDVSDPRNASILINVNGDLKPRAEATVSVFDSGFVLGDGAGASRMLQVRGPLMVKRSYLPATVTNETWRKDMKIIGEFVRSLKSPAPLFNATKAIYNAALAQGYVNSDTAAVCAVLERRSR